MQQDSCNCVDINDIDEQQHDIKSHRDNSREHFQFHLIQFDNHLIEFDYLFFRYKSDSFVHLEFEQNLQFDTNVVH